MVKSFARSWHRRMPSRDVFGLAVKSSTANVRSSKVVLRQRSILVDRSSSCVWLGCQSPARQDFLDGGFVNPPGPTSCPSAASVRLPASIRRILQARQTRPIPSGRLFQNLSQALQSKCVQFADGVHHASTNVSAVVYDTGIDALLILCYSPVNTDFAISSVSGNRATFPERICVVQYNRSTGNQGSHKGGTITTVAECLPSRLTVRRHRRIQPRRPIQARRIRPRQPIRRQRQLRH